MLYYIVQMKIINQIHCKIRNKGKGWVFTPRDFLKIRHFNTINPSLDRLESRGLIRSLGSGLYDYPVYNEDYITLKEPKLEAVIRALEVQLDEKLQFSGAYACFLLGLTKLPPDEIKYLSNKRNRNITVRNFKIKISKTLIPATRNKYDKATLAIQAIRYIGKAKFKHESLIVILNQLNDKEIKKLKKLTKKIHWIDRMVNG